MKITKRVIGYEWGVIDKWKVVKKYVEIIRRSTEKEV